MLEREPAIGARLATLGPTRTNVLSAAITTVRGAFFVVGAFSLFINLAALIVPLYMIQIYDRVLASQSRETLVALTALALALLVTVIFVEIARSRVLGARRRRA